jgi:hypothetical protein
MKNILYIGWLLGLSVVAVSCKKSSCTTEPIVHDNSCLEYPELDSSGITFFTNERFQYLKPCFNPNDPNEIIYNFRDLSSNKNQLVKFNAFSGLKTVLVENVVCVTQPKWSRKGWIAFDRSTNSIGQVFIVMDNGGSLTQRTFYGANYGPNWDASGDNLIWQHVSEPTTSADYYFFKQGLNEDTADTLIRNSDENNVYALHSDVSKYNVILTNTIIDNEAFLTLRPLSFEQPFTTLFNIFSEFQLFKIEGLTWSPTGESAYFTVNRSDELGGLYQINPATGVYTKLMDYCDSKKYVSISCSPIGHLLIGERQDVHLKRNAQGAFTGEIMVQSNIYSIDLKTMQETKIDLD